MSTSSSVRTRWLLPAGLLLFGLALSGCGMFRTDAAIGPDLKPDWAPRSAYLWGNKVQRRD